MPDIIDILTKRGRLIILLTLTATALALLISLLRPKEYLATATAVPANSALSDKARLFNNNIEALYPEIGSADELDRIEGTAKLDTIFLAVADSLNLVNENTNTSPNSRYEAAMSLKKNTDIRRSAYGELKISVWNRNPEMAANLSNALLEKLNDIHQHIQNRNNARILQKLRENLLAKEKELVSLQASILDFRASHPPLDADTSKENFQANNKGMPTGITHSPTYVRVLQNQINEHQEMIGKYELAVATSLQILVPVEHARPALSPDRPKVLQITLFAFGASLLFSFLLALFAENRRQKT